MVDTKISGLTMKRMGTLKRILAAVLVALLLPGPHQTVLRAAL